MRKIYLYILSIAAALSLVALPAVSASAFDPFSSACQGNGDSAVCTNTNQGDPLTGHNGLINKVTRITALFAGVVAVIIIIIGGMMYILSSGDAGKVTRAKDTILYAAVGLLVIAAGQDIITFVVGKL
jgi:hypothetical protein